MGKKNLSIFIPAYNAEFQIEKVIARIPSDLWPSVNSLYIINDGSTDGTQEKVDMLSSVEKRIKTMVFDKNRGYGSAVKAGLELCKKDGCEYAACVHADGQYPPEYIPGFIDCMEKEGYDLLQGSRIASGTALRGGMPLYKYLAGKCLTFLENSVFKLRMTDYHSGFLVYSRNIINRIDFQRLSSSFDFDLEVIASARAHKLSIGEMPIPARYADEISYLNPVTYGLRVLKVLCKYCMGRYDYRIE